MSEDGIRILPKSKEQLKIQHEIVKESEWEYQKHTGNVDRILSPVGTESIPVNDLQSAYETTIAKLPTYMMENVITHYPDAYQRYLEILRFARKRQKDTIDRLGIQKAENAQQHLDKSSQNLNKLANNLARLGNYTTNITQDEVQKVFKGETGLDVFVERIFVDKEKYSKLILIDASAVVDALGEDEFVVKLIELYNHNPKYLLKNYYQYEGLFSFENIKKHIPYAIEASLAEIDELKVTGEVDVFDLNKYKIQNQIRDVLSFINTAYYGGKDDPRAYLSKEEARVYALRAIKRIEKYEHIPPNAFQDLIEEGIINTEVINNLAIELLEQNNTTQDLRFLGLLGEYLDSDTTTMVAERAYDFISNDLKMNGHIIDNFVDVLTDEQLEKLVSSFINERSNTSDMRQGWILDLIKKGISKEGLKKIFVENPNNLENIVRYGEARIILETLHNNGLIAESEVIHLMRLNAMYNPTLAFEELINLEVDQETRVKLIDEFIPFVSPNTQLRYQEKWLHLIYPTKDERKEALVSLILDSASFDFVERYNQEKIFKFPEYEDEKGLSYHFNDEEIRTLVREIITKGQLSGFFVNIHAVSNLFNAADFNRDVLIPVSTIRPDVIVQRIDSIRFSTDPETLKIISENAFKSEYIYYYFENAVQILGYDWARDRLFEELNKSFNPGSWDRALGNLSENDKRQFIEIALKNNPAYILYDFETFKSYLAEFDLSYSDILIAASNNSFTELLPNYLPEELHNLEDVKKDYYRIKRLIYAYSYIQTIRNEGLDEVLAKLNKLSNRANSDYRNLHLVYTLAKIKKDRKDILSGQLESLNDPENISEILLDATAKLVGFEGVMTTTDKLLDDPEILTALVSLGIDFSDKDNLSILVRDIFTGEVTGGYENYKLPESEDSFDSLRSEGLLPKNLNYEQYLIWRNGLSMDSYEELTTNSEEVVQSIQRYLVIEAHHLQEVNELDIRGFDVDEIKRLEVEFKNIGIEIGRVSKLMKEAKTESNNMYQEYERKRKELIEKRKWIKTSMDIIKIFNLTPSEVLTGYIERKGEKINTIENLIEQTKDVLPKNTESIEILANVQKIISGLSEKKGISKRLTTKITSSPSVSLLIGARPVRTCQNYTDGEYRVSLPSFTSDPNTQIVYEEVESSPIGRAVLRLLENEHGDPELHLEHSYKSVNSAIVEKQIVEIAMRMAEKMGVKLKRNRFAQNEMGDLIGIQEVGGLMYIPSNTVLRSNSSKAPYQYVDSAGGIQTRGKYFVLDLVEVQRSNS